MIKVVFTTVVLLTSCCTNVVFLEALVKETSDSSNLLTFLQFSFIAAEGFLYRLITKPAKRQVPMKSFIFMVILFFASSLTNGIALNYNIPMPLHMVFKSGSLVANMFLGILIFGKTYKPSSFIAIFSVTIGILTCTFKTGWDKLNSNASTEDTTEAKSSSLNDLVLGTFFLVTSLLLSARFGLLQEQIFTKYKKSTREALFYNHFLPLPLFILVAPSILRSIKIYNQSPVQNILIFHYVPFLNKISLPILWQFVIINVITQHICIHSVFSLASECKSLTVTLVLTLRKLLSLIFSIYYFNNPFSLLHWCGAALVFLGTLIYTEIIQIDQFISPKKKD